MLSTRRLCLIILCLLVFIPTTAWLSLPYWLPLIAKQYARSQNIELQRLQISHFDHHSLKISQLSARSEDARLQARAIDVRWQWPKLLSGQLKKLTISSLELELTPGLAPEPAPGQAASISQLADLWQLPVQSVQVPAFTVNYAQTQISGELALNQQQLTLNARAEQILPGSRIKLTYSRHAPMRIRLHDQNQQPQGYAIIRPNEHALHISASLDLTTLPVRVLPPQSHYALAHIDGQLLLKQIPAFEGRLGLHAATPDLSLTGWQGFSTSGQTLHLTTDSLWQLSPGLNTPVKSNTPVQLSLRQPADIHPGKQGQLQLGTQKITLEQADTRLVVNRPALALSWQPGFKTPAALLILDHVRLTHPQASVSARASLRARYLIDKDMLSASTTLYLNEPNARVTGQLNGQLLKRPQLQYRWQLDRLEANALNAAGLPILPAQLTLSGGFIAHSGQFNWQPGHWQLSHQQHLENLSGQWNKQTFRNLTLTSQARASATQAWQMQGELHLQALNIGVPVMRTELAYQLKTQGPVFIRIPSASTEVLEGRALLSEPLELDKSLTGNTRITLERLSLSQILALPQAAELSGSGFVYGQLPLKIDRGSASVEQGSLYAERGRIRYRPFAPVTGQAQMDEAIAALRNFYYAPLAARVGYREDGQLTLRARLQGHNPDWRNGRPVDFSLNIEDNLNQLLRALRYSERINQRIEQHYQGR